MLDPMEFDKRPAFGRLSRLRRTAWFVLAAERGTRAFWSILSWFLFMAALWMLEVPSLMGKSGNALALILFAAGFVFFGFRGLKSCRPPAQNDIDRRLEQDSNIKHRPLAMLDDTLANPQHETTRTLWKAGRDSAFDVIARLHVPRPRPVLADSDPAALRILALLLFVAGVVIAGPAWKERIAFGLTPFSVHWEDRVTDNILVWVTPPEYTGAPQITLTGSGKPDAPVAVHAGSVIKVRVRNGMGAPHLIVGAHDMKLDPMGDDGWGGTMTVTNAAESLLIRQFFLPRLRLALNYIPDAPPAIESTAPPQAMARCELQFSLSLSDDYGISKLKMTVEPDPAVSDPYPPLYGAKNEDERAVAIPPGQNVETKPIYDLSAHPWAGLPVVITFTASDHTGQTAKTAPIEIKLPERVFAHAVAKKLVNIRKRIMADPGAAATFSTALEIGSLLNQAELYRGDIVVFLSLRSMASRLMYNQENKDAAISLIPQLWDTALRVEDGNLSLTARSLREAQEKLEALLADPQSTPEQIASAMEELRQALAAHLQEMFHEMMKQQAENGVNPQEMDPQQFQKALETMDLGAFLDQMQAQAMSGDREAARQMLSQLQEMMNPSQQSLEMAQEIQETMQNLAALREVIEKQKDLLEKTKEESGGKKPEPSYPQADPAFNSGGLEGMPPPPQQTKKKNQDQGKSEDGNKGDPSPLKGAQENLRRDLGGVMLETGESMDKIPENLQGAEKDMRGAEGALETGDAARAVPYQEQALEKLQQGEQAMSQQLSRMMQQMTFIGLGGSAKLDPLGRPMSEGNGSQIMPGSKIKIPDQAERKRIQEILETLRKRSGDYSRPDYELEYYRRLMKQF